MKLEEMSRKELGKVRKGVFDVLGRFPSFQEAVEHALSEGYHPECLIEIYGLCTGHSNQEYPPIHSANGVTAASTVALRMKDDEGKATYVGHSAQRFGYTGDGTWFNHYDAPLRVNERTGDCYKKAFERLNNPEEETRKYTVEKLDEI